MKKFVYSFKEGNKDMRDLLGGKGANLAEMTNIGLPVPSGFIVTTEACNKYYEDNLVISDEVIDQIFKKVSELEKISGKKLGDAKNPLLLSVRSGSRASMPGMMDTILNLGLNDQIVLGYTEAHNDPRFINDSYRRFIQMFSDVVKGYPKSSFEAIISELKQLRGITDDRDLTSEDMITLVSKFKEVYKQISGEEFPQDPKEQLIESITAVFRSWNNERARIYRKMHDIPSSWGTAVNVQEMVYGNRGDDCGTGVAFTRNPATGENKLYGEYLINAQGEDVVAGIRTPQPIDTLKEEMPHIYEEFLNYSKKLENHYKDMQDMEFTIENGKLFMLQTRNGKRTAHAALKIAIDLLNEGLITKEEALLKVDPNQLDQLLHPNFSEEALKEATVIATGLAASPGAATGKIYFTASDVTEAAKRGEDALLVREDTSPEDIQGMNDARGILTIRGGMTSHAAVVARGMGRCCISGCDSLTIDFVNKTLTTSDGLVLNEGDNLSLDGTTGKVYSGSLQTKAPEISGEFETFMNYADEVRTLGVRVNADTVRDAKQALMFGAEGIGLCRTEHMFFEESRIFEVRKMILADNEEVREESLKKLLPMQRKDFEGLFEVMNGKAVTIRYLDPPLHEFLPKTEKEIIELADALNLTVTEVEARIESLREVNPMMGHRGCRIAITYPEIAVMQTRAIIEAAINVGWLGIKAVPEIMIPLISDINELKYNKEIIIKTANEVMEEHGVKIDYHIGTMIETPRAAILADDIAGSVDFFSFGTNDLTQMTYGFSRDDASKFLSDYYEKRIFERDPFEKLDQDGVGRLVEMAVIRGKSSNKTIQLGICGEHGGEPTSVEFCHKLGLDYVSCSPFRIPIARLAAAQAKLKESR
ncbi:MAG: pyruvate, phosphate dikinase [Bacilli bacterium]|nr:pyruvate, phosphate dikinase [Bacilli bacterium]MDD4547810.1 pyruvate, phosphate dikinase [Bacilli bacterium]